MANNSKVVFKPYSPSQGMLLPPSLDELIPLSHPVRVVNELIEKVNLEILEKAYKGGGTSSYHPKMLLKILVYGYVSNVAAAVNWKQPQKKTYILCGWQACSNRPQYHQHFSWQTPAGGIKKHIYPSRDENKSL